MIWYIHIFFSFIHIIVFFIFKAKQSDVENLDEKIHNLQNLLVSYPI